MINRRNFLNSSILAAGVPLLGNAYDNTKHAADNEEQFYLPNNITPKANQTYYISHRGVHLKQRIAGENTIESLRLAKRVGFQCSEFDVRFTKDGKAVVIHDDTINRTLRDLNGNKLSQPVYVKDLTFDELRSQYVVYTENVKAKSIVPAFEEYLHAFNLYKLVPFVEIKEPGISKKQYMYLLDCLDAIIGRKNYVITSNNKVSDKLRAMGYSNILVMGILYQTTFEHIQSWKNAIMAVSASRFSAEKYQQNVNTANKQGILTESHADTLDKYNLIIRNGIDFISTDALMPEFTSYGQVIRDLDLDDGDIKELSTDGTIAGTQIELKSGSCLEISLKQYQHFFLYGAALTIELNGKCQCRIQEKEYELSTQGKEYFRYPVLLHKEAFTLKIKAVEACKITGLRLTITRF